MHDSKNFKPDPYIYRLLNKNCEMNKVLKSKKHSSIILIGPPNSGKTTLFNWLTGFDHKVVNYPGSTVLTSFGKAHLKYKLFAAITDTPGVYGLFPESEDERITKKSLFEKDKDYTVILVLDATKLEIQLPLFFQLKESGFPLVIALTMWDLNPFIHPPPLEKDLEVPVVPVKGLLGEGVWELVSAVKKLQPEQKKTHDLRVWNEDKFHKILKQSQRIVQKASLKKSHVKRAEKKIDSKFFDRFFLHPQIGFFLFTFIMLGLFYSIFWLASPFMEGIDRMFSFLIEVTSQKFSAYPYFADFLSKGFLASLGAVFIFVPQIFILFIGIALLEDTGYLARAVALMDGPLSKIGLSGQTFIPFLSGYACAIPAVLSARNLSSKREKAITFFAIPFMSCSARLPVYTLLLSFLFYGQSSWKPGLALILIYLCSFLLGMLSVFFLNLIIKKEEKNSFLLDLPLYRRPIFKNIIKKAVKQTQHYIVKAGPVIFTFAVFIWALMSFPMEEGFSDTDRIQNSYAGKLGLMIEPAFEIMGLDWRVGLALIAAFAAREVFVSSLILVLSVTEMTTNHSLIETMSHATSPDGSLIFTTASVTGLIVFFMFSMQCLSTTAIIYKESGSWKLPLVQLILLNISAYILAVLCYQSLNLIL